MNRTLLCLALTGIGITGVFAQQPPPAEQRMESTERFNGTVAVQDKAGASKTVPVTLRNWSLRGGQGARGVQTFPARGFLMVHVLSGRIRSLINGTSQEWKEGDVWTLPANATMMVEVLSETAVVQTLSVGAVQAR